MVFGCPITSSSVCPNIRWAAEFQFSIMPDRFLGTISREFETGFLAEEKQCYVRCDRTLRGNPVTIAGNRAKPSGRLHAQFADSREEADFYTDRFRAEGDREAEAVVGGL
jgi:hypothetical protein